MIVRVRPEEKPTDPETGSTTVVPSRRRNLVRPPKEASA
jgi:hypothetical protein